MSATLLLSATAIIEGATAVALMLFPAVAVSLLFAADLPPIGAVVARFVGIALLALAVACWLERQDKGRSAALSSMLLYSILATLFFAFLAFRREFVGPLLWPALVFHAGACLLLGAAFRSPQQ